jgi:hypothetical protein
MDLEDIRRLATGGIGAFPPTALPTAAAWLWDYGEATGDARYCSLSRTIEMITAAFDANYDEDAGRARCRASVGWKHPRSPHARSCMPSAIRMMKMAIGVWINVCSHPLTTIWPQLQITTVNHSCVFSHVGSAVNR